mgnify:CR=1 FL=1
MLLSLQAVQQEAQFTIKMSHQKTVSVVSVDNLAGQYYMDDTNLDGNIVTSAIQNITVDKDMIIQEVYVSKDDEVKKRMIN